MTYPEVSTRELIENIKSDDFCKNFGNPVKCKVLNEDRVLISFELYERLFGKVDLEKENTVEVDDFIRMLVLQRLNESPAKVEQTDDGYLITIDTDIYENLNRITLDVYDKSLEKMMTEYFEWIASNPEEFKSWVGKCNSESGEWNDNQRENF